MSCLTIYRLQQTLIKRVESNRLKIDITFELVVIGGAASVLVEILKALLLSIDKYPRVKALWPLLPAIFGVILALLFPSSVPSSKSVLVIGAHGFLSPIVFYFAYPIIQKQIEKQVEKKSNNIFDIKNDDLATSGEIIKKKETEGEPT